MFFSLVRQTGTRYTFKSESPSFVTTERNFLCVCPGIATNSVPDIFILNLKRLSQFTFYYFAKEREKANQSKTLYVIL